MNIIEFIFNLLKRFALISTDRQNQLMTDANAWYQKKQTEQPGQETWLGNLIKNYGNLWYIQVGFAILYIFALRQVFKMLNPDKSDWDDDEKKSGSFL